MPSCNHEGNGKRIRDAGSDCVLTEPMPAAACLQTWYVRNVSPSFFQLLRLRLPVTCPCHIPDLVLTAGHIGCFQSFHANNDGIMTIHTHISLLNMSCRIHPYTWNCCSFSILTLPDCLFKFYQLHFCISRYVSYLHSFKYYG